MAMLQVCVCFVVAFFLGLAPSMNVLLTIIVLIPAAVLFISIGLLCGSLFNDRQVGGICGALLTNLSAWLSGTWFDIDLVGGAFKNCRGTSLPSCCQCRKSRHFRQLFFNFIRFMVGNRICSYYYGHCCPCIHKKMNSDKI